MAHNPALEIELNDEELQSALINTSIMATMGKRTQLYIRWRQRSYLLVGDPGSNSLSLTDTDPATLSTPRERIV